MFKHVYFLLITLLVVGGLQACADRSSRVASATNFDGVYTGNWDAVTQLAGDAEKSSQFESNVIIHGNKVTVTDGQFVATGKLHPNNQFEATTGPHFSLADDDTSCIGELVFSGQIDEPDVESAVVSGSSVGMLKCTDHGVSIAAKLSGQFETVKRQTISKIFVPSSSLLDLFKRV
ncbi:hypothetical protein [Arenicella xantha]|uniref:Polymer-forming protein n=1 Tax=Arenicella xantha TaxID=644221 RepID=A0A395JHS8_9GAMM|nr:hypothetical protein [Arenicella xantha]RBP49687.1 hypothetical protein DFR28_103112 [Arenicella xantha]